MKIDNQRAAFEAECVRHAECAGADRSALDFSRDGAGYKNPSINTAWWAYQSALESPEVRALRKDAQRYLWIRAHWTRLRTTYYDNKLEFFITEEAFCDLTEADIDAAIDAAMEK